MPDSLSERDEVTLRILAIIERTTVAEQRREALRSYARRAREDTDVAEIVNLILDSRHARHGGTNMIRLEGRRG